MKIKPLYFQNLFFLFGVFFRSIAGFFSAKNPVLVHIPELDIKRPSLLLAKLFRNSGSDVFVSADPVQLIKMGEYGRLMFRDKRVFLDLRLVKDYDSVVAYGALPRRDAKRFFLLDLDVFSRDRVGPGDIFLPIMFHPNFLEPEIEKETESLFEARREREVPEIGIFFAGAFAREDYDKPETRETFSIMTRHEIIETLRAEFSGSALYEPEDYASLLRDAGAGLLRDKLVICDSARVKIPQTDWFRVLSRAGYFLSPPGVLQPFCHNTVESMSVGTVPILQYPDRFIPSFEGGVNCLTFENGPDLIETVRSVLCGAPGTARRALSSSAREYFEQHLSNGSFASRLSDIGQEGRGTRRIFICQNRISMALYRDRITADK